MKKLLAAKYKVTLVFAFFIALVVMLEFAGSNKAMAGVRNLADSTARKLLNHKPVMREVLTSQQLFVVNTVSTSGSPFSLKGELRGAFMIVGYLDNGSVEELKWTMCPDGKCPETGTFKAGTKEYAHLDSLITKFKPLSQE